jgi:VRR-NUC domain
MANKSPFGGLNEPTHPVADARAPSSVPALEPFYYLKNFELVLATIRGRYTDLLLQEELQFIDQFPRVPLSSRALLARLVMRRGDLFRAGKIDYAEIGDTRAAAAPLIEAGWLSDRPVLNIQQLRGLLKKSELIRCLNLPGRYARWRKADLGVVLDAQFTERREFSDWYGADDFVYALLIGQVCERFKLLFFGNDRQSWSEFVTADLKIFNYEKVARSAHDRPFQTRAQIELFLRLRDCRELLENGMPLDELAMLLPGLIEDSEWLEERRQELWFRVAREYERAAQLSTALSMYLQCNQRGARTRAIRVRCRARDWEGARAMCVLAKQNPESEAELQYIQRALPRLTRKLKLACDPDEPAARVPEFEIVLQGAPRAGALEHHVCNHLACEAGAGEVRYVENDLINALFGLLCWPAIFAPVAGAFFHDFHNGPMDLESGHFYGRRMVEFAHCLSHLDSSRYIQVIWKAFRQKWGIQSPFVRWHHLDKTLLQWALACFPAAHLRLWFEWIVWDVKENRAGFPDLVQFWPADGRYRLIEVKGPGDRVQDNQRRLLEYCVSHQMPVSVCRVRWPGTKRSGCP